MPSGLQLPCCKRPPSYSAPKMRRKKRPTLLKNPGFLLVAGLVAVVAAAGAAAGVATGWGACSALL